MMVTPENPIDSSEERISRVKFIRPFLNCLRRNSDAVITATTLVAMTLYPFVDYLITQNPQILHTGQRMLVGAGVGLVLAALATRYIPLDKGGL